MLSFYIIFDYNYFESSFAQNSSFHKFLKKMSFFSPVLCFISEAEVIQLLNVWLLEKLEWPSFAPMVMYSCVQRKEAQRSLAPGHSRWVRQLSLHSNILRGNLRFWNMWKCVLNSIQCLISKCFRIHIYYLIVFFPPATLISSLFLW